MTETSTPVLTISSKRKWLRRSIIWLLILLLLLALALVGVRIWLRGAMRQSLPVIDGSVQARGLHNPVRVERDEHGVPHLIASSMDDLVFTQGYVTAQDRLWQMDVLRRHAAGELAEILGGSLIPHDKLQRTLQLRTTADKAIAALDPEERHWLEVYAAGVNAFIDSHRTALPAEFRALHYQPASWTASDGLLVGYAMAQDLSTNFQDKLNREAVAAHLPPQLQADLYPVGSWRDHPPAAGKPDLTAPTPFIEIPLDESQSKLNAPEHVRSLESVTQTLSTFVSHYRCDGCAAGSNNWAVSGAHTANGHPLLANDMHLALGLPGIWYEAVLEAGNFHVAGVTLPGVPFVIVGHNQHIAWGFTNSGADVQDVYIEMVNGDRFRAADGTWKPLLHRKETIHVRGSSDVQMDIAFTQHGSIDTPILSPLYKNEKRAIALLWSIYDVSTTSSPFGRVNSASNWDEFTAAFSQFGAPSQNAVYADDQGHIGYHMIGKVPVRGDKDHPAGLTPVPVPTGSYEWSGYIPYSEMPQVLDPPGGILATANARTTPDDYNHAITLDWESPYRNERIWQVLSNSDKLTQKDMLALQNDTMSELDQTLAHRIAYAVDHAHAPSKRAKQAADILRTWKGDVALDQVAPNLVMATRDALWPMLLRPYLGDSWKLYTWRSRSFVLEDLVTHTPARWLPKEYASWDELLTAALEHGLSIDHAPGDLSQWTWKKTNVVQLMHPLFGVIPAVRHTIGGTLASKAEAVSGDTSTVHVGGRTHGASERFVVDPSNPDGAWLNIVTGQSGNPASEWYLDQFPYWVQGKTLTLPFTSHGNPAHTLLLTP